MLENPINSCLRVQLVLDKHPIYSCMNAQLVHAWASDEFTPQVHHEFTPEPHWPHMAGFGIQGLQGYQCGRWPWTALCRWQLTPKLIWCPKMPGPQTNPQCPSTDSMGRCWRRRGQENGREDLHGRGCSMPKGCVPESLQLMDTPAQGRDTLIDCGHGWPLPAQWHWEARGDWKRPSETHEAVTDRRNCCVHSPSLLHCPLVHWGDWEELSVTCGANKRSWD